MIFDQAYWTERWNSGQTGWDIGYPSPALIDFAHTHIPKQASILIPGAGNSYEAETLYRQGYKNIFVVDIAHVPLQNFAERMPDFPIHQLIHSDFFELKNVCFDFILEQTFFCALDPSLRDSYVQTTYQLLHTGGQVAGLLFDFPLTNEGPPFGGCYDEYVTRFSKHFDIITLERCTKSIKPRLGREFFFHLKKKSH
ncbi:MAG: methyltransferase domain-containing protein [Thermaurantimonas sp.]